MVLNKGKHIPISSGLPESLRSYNHFGKQLSSRLVNTALTFVMTRKNLTTF